MKYFFQKSVFRLDLVQYVQNQLSGAPGSVLEIVQEPHLRRIRFCAVIVWYIFAYHAEIVRFWYDLALFSVEIALKRKILLR